MLETSISFTGTYSTCGVSILKSILRSPSDSQVALGNLIIREYQAIIWEDAYSPFMNESFGDIALVRGGTFSFSSRH